MFMGYSILLTGSSCSATKPAVILAQSSLVTLKLGQFRHATIPWHVSDTQFGGVTGLLSWYGKCYLATDRFLGKKPLYTVA